jgi:hypothetical protein
LAHHVQNGINDRDVARYEDAQCDGRIEVSTAVKWEGLGGRLDPVPNMSH